MSRCATLFCCVATVAGLRFPAVLPVKASATPVAPNIDPEPSFTLPPSLVKPLASGVLVTAETFPKLLPFAHMAMDFLVESQGVTSAAKSQVAKAALAASPSPVSVLEPPKMSEDWGQMLSSTFAFAAQALVTLLAARLELLMINLRLALRARRLMAMEAMQQKVATVSSAPMRFMNELQEFTAQKRREFEGAFNGVAQEFERQKDQLTGVAQR